MATHMGNQWQPHIKVVSQVSSGLGFVSSPPCFRSRFSSVSSIPGLAASLCGCRSKPGPSRLRGMGRDLELLGPFHDDASLPKPCHHSQ